MFVFFFLYTKCYGLKTNIFEICFGKQTKKCILVLGGESVTWMVGVWIVKGTEVFVMKRSCKKKRFFFQHLLSFIAHSPWVYSLYSPYNVDFPLLKQTHTRHLGMPSAWDCGRKHDLHMAFMLKFLLVFYKNEFTRQTHSRC